MPILEVNRVQKIYTARSGGSQVQALRSVSFDVEQGEYVAIMGESGSGKTTLLNILAALDKPTAGTVLLDGRDLSGIKSTELSAFRRDHLGFVFQDFNLLDTAFPPGQSAAAVGFGRASLPGDEARGDDLAARLA